MIVDCHMHVWPDHIADAMQSQRPSGMPLRFDGKLSGLQRTMDEAGIKGFNLDTWAGLVAPAGTPPQVVNKLNGALRKIIDSPEVQARFKNVGFEGFSSTPEELGDFIKAQLALWGKMIKDANIQMD